jgi:hypothetical protein
MVIKGPEGSFRVLQGTDVLEGLRKVVQGVEGQEGS